MRPQFHIHFIKQFHTEPLVSISTILNLMQRCAKAGFPGDVFSNTYTCLNLYQLKMVEAQLSFWRAKPKPNPTLWWRKTIRWALKKKTPRNVFTHEKLATNLPTPVAGVPGSSVSKAVKPAVPEIYGLLGRTEYGWHEIVGKIEIFNCLHIHGCYWSTQHRTDLQMCSSKSQ